MPDGVRRRSSASELLQKAGLELKGEDGPPVDLGSGKHVSILGFRLTAKNNNIAIKLGREAWTNLVRKLKRAAFKPNSAMTAKSIIAGFISAYAPAFEKPAKASKRIWQLLKRLSLSEACPQHWMLQRASDAYANWLEMLSVVQKSVKSPSTLSSSLLNKPAAAPPAHFCPELIRKDYSEADELPFDLESSAKTELQVVPAHVHRLSLSRDRKLPAVIPSGCPRCASANALLV